MIQRCPRAGRGERYDRSGAGHVPVAYMLKLLVRRQGGRCWV